MAISIAQADGYVSNMDKRMAFHFGNVVATEGPHHFLEITLEIDGDECRGLSMVGMAPMWFIKDPDISLSEATEDLLDVFEAARKHALEIESTSVFEFWFELYERQREWAGRTDHPPLLWAYGVSMVEQALIDAFCRYEDIIFADAVRRNAFGVQPGWIYDELAETTLEEYLPKEPTRDAAVRHTVGLTDPLRTHEIEETDRLNDGLPQALEEYVEEQGTDHFKIKLSADAERDADRLAAIGDVLAESAIDSYFCTLDANEQYDSVRTFKEQWERHATDPAITNVIDHVAYIEQPLPRSAALTDETREVLSEWDERPPIIIDESDDHLDSAGRALECGYAGTSHKNCKGVFKGLINACLIEKRRHEGGDEYIMSGEDLTTIGPVELLQDLAVMGTIGLDHIERNGHHYYRGLSYLPSDLQSEVLEAHGDLYGRHEEGFVALDVKNGRMEFESVIDAPFGRDFELDPTRFTPVEEWSVESMYE